MNDFVFYSPFAAFGREVFGITHSATSEEAGKEAASQTIDRLQEFFVSMGMPRSLNDFGLDESSIDRLLDGLEKSKGRIFGAFKPLGREDARAIYQSAFKN